MEKKEDLDICNSLQSFLRFCSVEVFNSKDSDFFSTAAWEYPVCSLLYDLIIYDYNSNANH